jgi:hypothetical protein
MDFYDCLLGMRAKNSRLVPSERAAMLGRTSEAAEHSRSATGSGTLGNRVGGSADVLADEAASSLGFTPRSRVVRAIHMHRFPLLAPALLCFPTSLCESIHFHTCSCCS